MGNSMRVNRFAFAVIAILAVASIVTLLAFVSPYLVVLHDPNGVTLGVSLNSTTLAQNQSVRVTVSDRNGLYFPNELSLSENWRVQNLSMGPCSFYARDPFGIAVYQGRYTLDNISIGKTVAIYDIYSAYYCPAAPFSIAFEFGPLQNVSRYVDLSGYWTPGETTHPDGGISEGVLHRFIPGVYTLVAGDEWGHVKITYFRVSGLGL
jgi:hypothetical protein